MKPTKPTMNYQANMKLQLLKKENELAEQRLQQALELKQLEYKLKEEEHTLKLRLQCIHQLQIKDLQVKRYHANQKIYEIISKLTRAIDNQRSKADIQEIYAALTEAFDHFCKIHKQYHGLLEDEDDIESSQYYFKTTHNDFTGTKGKMDNFIHMKDLKVKSCNAKQKLF